MGSGAAVCLDVAPFMGSPSWSLVGNRPGREGFPERTGPFGVTPFVRKGELSSTQLPTRRAIRPSPEVETMLGNRSGAGRVHVSGASEDEHRAKVASGAAAVVRSAWGSRAGRSLAYARPGGGSMQVDDESAPFGDRDDAWLIHLAGEGDHAAYGELVRRYAAIAHRTATWIVGPADAEDAVQE